jgi:hypothetical protein
MSIDTGGLYEMLLRGFKTVFLHTVCQNRAGLSIQGAHERCAEKGGRGEVRDDHTVGV